MRVTAIILCTLGLASCGPIDPDPVVDEDGNVIVVPGPFDEYLVATPLYEDTAGLRPVLRWQLNAYLDEDQLLDFSAVSLVSGGIVASGRVKWRMSDRVLEFRPFADLETGLRYRPVLNAAVLFSVTGSPLGAGPQRPFVVDRDVEVEDPAFPVVAWPEVDAILEAKCRSCHADPQWQLNPLTRDSIVGVRSDQTDATLVVPFDPGDSYLLHKVLDDFPRRRFTIQPPPWSDAVSLTPDETLKLERWILNGAQG